MLNFGLHAFGYEEANTSWKSSFQLKVQHKPKQVGHKASYIHKKKKLSFAQNLKHVDRLAHKENKLFLIIWDVCKQPCCNATKILKFYPSS